MHVCMCMCVCARVWWHECEGCRNWFFPENHVSSLVSVSAFLLGHLAVCQQF